MFLKTHKTASTTLATIIQRYGYKHNLTFALPVQGYVFQGFRPFKINDVYQYNKYNHPAPSSAKRESDGGAGGGADFHMLVNHVVYNRPEMEATVPNALYVTSLRDPVRQFESAFVYFDMARQTGVAKSKPDPISAFMANAEELRTKIGYGKWQLQNGQLYDLGLTIRGKVTVDGYATYPYHVRYKIGKLDDELDLVVITEYFDESLILLKKLLCWELDDIVYVRKRTRQAEFRYELSADVRDRVRRWNHADVMLYEHFNRTLWRKISEYGPNFWRELQQFRNRVDEITVMCDNHGNATSQQGDDKTNKTVMKDELHHMDIVRMDHGPKMCQELYRYDSKYVDLIRAKMKSKSSSAGADTGGAFWARAPRFKNNNKKGRGRGRGRGEREEEGKIKGERR